MTTDAPQDPDAAATPDTSDATPSKPRKSPDALDPRALLVMLQAASVTFRDYKPVALRIDKAVGERFPEVDRKVVRAAMRIHTTSTRYLKAMEKATHRFDFDGNENGELSAEHRAHAAQTLKERFAESARKKREKQKLDELRQREEEAERRKSEKLQQLVGRFSKS
nr:ProQ/FinO family protein [Zoogloeaceae bacterium]